MFMQAMRNLATFVWMNFSLGGGSLRRLGFYLFYHVTSRTPFARTDLAQNAFGREFKRVYKGRLYGHSVVFRFQDVAILRDVLIDRVYQVDELKNCKRIIDVGAHIGAFAIYMLNNIRGVETIVCFEPQKESFEMLVANLSRYKGIRPLRAALSNVNKKGRLYIHDFSAAHSLRIVQRAERYENVRVRRLDDITKGPVDLIKIDAEGAEAEILRGAERTLRAHKPLLLIETGHFKGETNQINKELRRLGYHGVLLDAKEPIIFAKPRDARRPKRS